MTSKISFSKMVLNDSKRRLWLFILLSVGFLLTIALTTAIFFGLQQSKLAAGDTTYGGIATDLQYLISNNDLFVAIGIVISAVLGAFSGFGYLYKRTTLDVFHSIPVKREKLFLVQYVSGIIIFIVPFIISYLLMLLICALNGFASGAIVGVIMQNIGYGVLHFLAYYGVAIVAIMLTGKMIVGILGMLVFWGYMPMLSILSQGLYHRFFVTQNGGECIPEWLAYISPVTVQSARVMSSLMGYYEERVMWLRGMMLTIEVAIILLTFVVSMWLYRKRASEAAEQAMAFPKTMPILKVLIMVLLSLGTGLFLDVLTGSTGSTVWFALGIVLGLIISQGLIAVIYTGDIRKILTGKKSFVVASLIVIAIASIFVFDLFGYDSYMPNPDKVKSVGISISGLDDQVDYSYVGNSVNYTNDARYPLNNGQVEDVPTVYELAKQGVANAKAIRTRGNAFGIIREENVEEYRQVEICYQMNNGNKVSRVYSIDAAQMELEIAKIYDEPSFKKAEYPVLSIKEENISDVFAENVFGDDGGRGIPAPDKQKLIEAYQADLMELKFADIKDVGVIGTISYELKGPVPMPQVGELEPDKTMVHSSSSRFDGKAPDYPIMEYPIYPACTRTLAILKELGLELDGEIDLSKVEKIELERYKDAEGEYGYEDGGYVGIDITDKNEMEELLATPIYSTRSRFYQNVGAEQMVLVYFGKEDDSAFMAFSARAKDLPAFVEDKFKNDAKQLYE